MVALIQTGRLRGGGSLIHPKVVLTTYHVIAKSNYRKMIVRAGGWEMNSTQEICAAQESNITRVIRPEDFDFETRVNNVALLLLEKEFKMTAVVNTVCLAPAYKPKYVDNDCWSGGWEKDKFGAQEVYQNFLKKINMPLMDFNECEQKLISTGMMEDGWRLHEGQMCAGESTKT
jgi:secreted trypsin-like serine protease